MAVIGEIKTACLQETKQFLIVVVIISLQDITSTLSIQDEIKDVRCAILACRSHGNSFAREEGIRSHQPDLGSDLYSLNSEGRNQPHHLLEFVPGNLARSPAHSGLVSARRNKGARVWPAVHWSPALHY